MKKALLVFLYLLLSLLLPACSSTPAVPYYDRLYIKAEATGDWSRVEKYEADAEKAEAWEQHKAACNETNGYVWFCMRHGGLTRAPKDPVQAYRRERGECACVSRSELRRIFN